MINIRIASIAMLILCLAISGVGYSQSFTNVAASKGVALGGNKDGGFSFADLNGDGYLDLIVNTDQGDDNHRTQLYFNQGPPNYNFVNVTATHANNLRKSVSTGCSEMERCAVVGDLNHDGYPDFVRNSSCRVEVWLNKGPNASPAYSFGDANQKPNWAVWTDNVGNNNPANGIPNGMNTEGIGFFDYDNDGDLDLMVENHNFGIDIYRNEIIPTGTFSLTHVTPGSSGFSLGLPNSAADGDYGSVTDFDDDGYIDLIARKRDQEDFFRNLGNGTFQTVPTSTNNFNQQANNNNKGAVSLYDFDNDGDYDLVWTDNDPNQIWQQSGAGTGVFNATGEPWASAGLSMVHSGIDGVACGDIDNDGDIDLFFGGDHTSYLFRNITPKGSTNLKFELITSINTGGANVEGCTFVDFDNDGDLDLYLNIRGGNNQLWQNNLNDSDFLMVEVLENLNNLIPNRHALGANIVLKDCDGSVLSGIREVNGGNGHGTQDPAVVHFGLPLGANKDYVVEVHYPYYNGTRKIVQEFVNPSQISGYQKITITPQSMLTVLNPSVTSNTGNLSLCGANSNIQLTVNSGDSFLWSTGATTSTITVNTPGTYTVTVTYNNGCDASTSVNVTTDTNCPDWQYDCGNTKVEIVGKGAKSASSTTLNFTDVSTIDSIVIEAVCKNQTLPTSATFTSSSQNITSTNRLNVINGNGDQGIFRVKMNPASSITVSTNQRNQTYSVIAYVYRSGVATASGGSGFYTNAYIYKNLINYTLSVPATPGNKTLTLTVPITEMDNDSRVAIITATAGTVTSSRTINTYANGNSLNLVTLTLNNVPGNVTSVNVNINSPNSNGDSFLSGVSINTESCCTPITANIVKTDVACKADSTSYCTLTLATSQHGLWLNNIPNAPSKYYKIVGGSATATKYSDGRLHITGTFENVNDANRKWSIDVMYTNKMNWTEFNARGGTWKGQANNVGNNYLDWDYYIMDVNYANKLVGSGTFAGKTLNLTHMPSNYLYGFQVGQGANDFTSDWGMSGWFEHTGSWTGKGDINFDAVCDSTEYTQSSTCNGTADLTVSGGAAPYTYTWSNGGTSQDVAGLCAGSYTVTITDAYGCTTTKSVTIGSQSTPLTVTCNSTDVTIQGGSNGIASVTVSGGATPYSYLWSTGQTTQSVNNRPAGVYSVTVTDKFGCELVYECCIKQPSVCEGFRTQTMGGWGASPSGGNPGAYVHANFASAFPNGVTIGCPSGGFTLKLTSAQAVTDFLPSGSTARALTANLTNPGGSYKNVLAGQVMALSLSVGFDNANPNFGPSTTALQDLVIASGPFATWTVAQALAEANKKLGGCASSYSFSQLNDVITKINENYVDGNNTGNFLICGLELTTVKVDVKCYGQNTGSIDLTVSGGVMPYTYAWSNGATSQDLTNVAAGTYSVTVTATGGLTATASVTINQPAQLTLTTTKTDLDCNGACTGTASVTASGGTSPYTYKWNTNATSAAISSLCAGTYTVTVTDANGCTATETATLTQPTGLTGSITKTDVSCGSGNIPCQLFQYAPGSHAVYLPNLGLSSDKWVFGPQGGTIETYANGTARIYGNIYFHNDTTKSFFLDFNFSNKMTWAQWSALGRGWKGSAGTVGNNFENWDYYIFSTSTPSTLTGRNAYTGNNLNVTHNPSNYQYGLQIGLAANDKNGNYGLSTWFNHTGWKTGHGDINANLVCVQGQCDGTTDVTVNGGTAPYTYSWNNGATSQDLSGLCPGTYTITITDSKGCTKTLTATIESGSELVLNATGTNIACVGVCNGTATVSASGGSTPYTYAWSNGATTQSLNNICAGTYIVTVTDSKGCFGRDTVVITANPKPEITATASPVDCFGGATGSVTTVATGGTTPYSYTWTPGSATTANLNNVAAGTYTVILTDVNGCKDTASATITQPASAISATISSTPVSCIGGNDGTAAVVASGGTAPYIYSWSTTPARTTAGITGLNVGSYSVTVTDANGCTVSKTVQVTGVPALTLGSVPTPVLCNGGNTGSINLTVNGGSAPYTFNWSNGATTEDISGLTAGNYNVTVTDKNGCVATAGVSVTQPQPINATANATNVNCNGGSTGAVSLSVSGGTTPFTYVWSNGATTKDISGLTAGTYSVTITDKNKCTATASATVTEKDSINVITNATHVSCTGGTTGSITTTVTGGTSPFTYAWSNGATSANLNNLSAGVYYLTVTDANGCIALDTTGIVQRDSIEIIVDTIVNAKCYGDTGSVTITVVGGTPVCTPGTFTPATTCTSCTQTISGNQQNIFITAGQKVCVLAGTTFTGSLNMSGGELVICGTANPSNFSTTGGTITVIGSLNVNVLNLETALTVHNYGSINANTNITGNGKLYNYGNISVSNDLDINSNGGLFENYGITRVSNNLNNSGTALNNGTIFISNSLQNNGGATFTNNCNLTASVNFLNNSLFNNNGQIVVGVTSFLNGNSTLNMGIGAQHCTKNVHLNGLLHGPATACASFKVTGNSTINGSGVVNGNISYCDLNGIETNTGTISGGASLSCTCQANNPSNAYTYTVLWSTGDTTTTVNGLPAGTYTVTVTDASGCTSTKSVTITQPDSISTSITKTDVSCGGGNIPCQLFQYAPGSHAVYLPNLGLNSTKWVFGPQGGTIETYANGTARIYGNIYFHNDTTKSFFLDFNFSNKMTWAQWSALGRGWKGSAGTVGNNYENWDYYIFSTSTPSTLTGRNAYTGNNLNVTHNPSNYQYGLQIGLAANDKNGNYGLSTWFNHTGWKTGHGDINANLVCVQGQCDGAADLTVNGGTAPYTYAWNNGSTSQDLSGLCPGTYTVTVTDKNGCVKIETVTIESGDELIVNTTGTNIACAGVCNGTANATVSGGTAPYTYLWSNGETTPSLSNICAGTYIVTVTDSKGCFGRDTVVITANPKPEITATASPVDCFGGATGSIATTVTGGTSPFTYLWTPSGATTANLSNATAGTYTVILTDVNGCKDTASATITQPADSLDGTTSSTPVSCIGGTDGTASVVATGGTAPYTYAWSTTPTRTTATITGLRVGNYTVTITDSKGCTVVRTVTVTGVPPLTIGSVPSPVLCNGGNTGSINLTINGGTPGYTFQWSNGATTEDISGLTAGTYNVTVTDANGCVATAGVTVGQPQPLVATGTPINIACFGANNGGVNISVVGGTSPFTYLWSNGATTRDITGIAAGTYTVTVTDVNGCKDTVSATVTQQAALSVTATPTDVTCFGLNNGSITTSVNGGVAPYTYTWGAGQPTTANRSNLAPGTYTVTVTDANNCTGTATATITQPDLLTASATGSALLCFGDQNGAATLTVAGGTAPFTYAWSNQATTQNLTGLVAGNYDVTITDANGCTATASASVTEPTLLAANATGSAVSCFGDATGTVTLTVTGGITAYTYLWSNGATTQNLSGLAAGAYTVTVTDANGCTATASASVTEPTLLTASATGSAISCYGDATGTATLTVSGGTTAYTYLWSNGATTQNLTGLSGGAYSVTVTDANGCTALASATVTEPADSLDGTTSSTPVSCIGGTDGTASVVATGGTAPYTYAWSTTPTRTTATITGLRVGNFTVTISDSKGCNIVRTVTVTGVPPLTIGSVPTAVLCNGGNTGSINLTINGGTPGYTFQWSNGATTEDISGLTAGNYNVTVTDANGCVATAGVTVQEPQPLVATATPVNIACNGAATGGVNLSIVGGTSPFTYTWSNGATTRDITGLTAGTYSVTVTDKNNCTATASATVTQQDALSVTATPTDVTCFGLDNGSITTSVNGGAAPYTYTWGAGQPTTANLSSLAPGTYTVTVTDANNCTGTATATITQPSAALEATATKTDVGCFGESTGAADLTVTGGTTPYTYSWSNGATTEDLTALAAGTYAVTVTDAKACTATASVTIGQPDTLTANITKADVSCGGSGPCRVFDFGGSVSHAFWLPSLPNIGDNFVFAPGGGYFEELPNGKAHIYGIIYHETDTNYSWTVDVWFSDKMDWTAWSALGRDYKDEAGLAGNNYLNWDYYIFDLATPSTLTGRNIYAGETVTLTHNPANYEFGLQVGLGANSKTADYGMATWFSLNGPYTGKGDINANLVCTQSSCDGAADLAVAGGTAPYVYTWSNGDTTQDLSSLCEGGYGVTVTDANGCIATDTVTIEASPSLVVDATSTNVTCSANCDGTAQAMAVGGTAPYTYVWSNGDTTMNITGLCGGSYTVTVTDSKGCSGTNSVFINANPLLEVTVTPTPVNCFAGSNGTATTNVTGGLAPYTYLWSNGATTADLQGLVAGTYAVTVTDANGCVNNGSAIVTQPADSLDGTTSSTPVSCIGGTDGTASVVATGGTAPYTYAWSTTPTRTTATITGLRVGNFTVTITDSKGCIIVRTVTVTGVPPLTIGSVPTAVLCNGGNTGSINLTINGGTPGYTFQWSNGATTEDISGLTAGNYNVTVTDANGCVATAGVTVQEPQPLVATATPVNIACNGAATGGVNLSIVGGTSPFTYTWSNGATTRDITGLTAGTYSVTVTDKNNCTATASATVTQQDALIVTVDGNDLTCFANRTGGATTAVVGGLAPYTYIWSNGGTDADLINLPIGTYSVTVTDANGCTGTGSATLTQPDTLTATAVGSAVSCFGDATGTVTLTVTGGTTAYSYVWSNGATTQNLTGLVAGNYNVTITDANGCTATASATVTEPTLLVATATGSAVNCFGDATGTITLDVTGGRTGYTYLWSTGATTKELNGVGAGTYTVTVTDANRCTATATATVTEPALLVADGTNTNVLCNGESTATVTLSVTGGTTPYTYAWSNGATSQNLADLAAGTYTVTVTDANACTATKSFTVTEADALTASATAQDVRCFLGSDGSVNLTVGGGVSPYTYLWSNNATTRNLTALRVGTYTVTVTDANGCTITASAVVGQPGPLTLGGVPSPVKCFGGSTGAINLSATGGVAPYTYVWSNGETTEDISNLTAGMYNVTVTDAQNCVATVGVNVLQPAVITLSFVGVDVTTNGGTDGSIDLSVVGGTSPFTYTWSNGATTQDLNNIAAGNYCVTVTDVNGCTATGCETITEPACTGFNATVVSTNVNCNGGNNGTATLTVNGGAAPFTYAWSNGAATKDLTGLAAGTYTVTVTDAVSCQTVENVTITEPATLTAMAMGTNPSCSGQVSGSVTLTVTGGTSPYTYSWSNQATTQDLTGLVSGTYTVTVTDANGCTATSSATIAIPTAISIVPVATPVRCFLGSDGGVSITATGGTAPYTYAWSNNATTRNITALRAGSYTVTVTDANGCTATSTSVVSQPGPLTLGGSPSPVSCAQGSDGAINLTVNGGTAPYNFNWSNGATTEDISGLAAGTYNVTVTDARGCVGTVSVTVLEPAAIVLTANVTDACAGGNSGAIQMNVVGGTSPFTYAWSNGASTKNVGSLAPGIYTATVTDSKGCTATNSFTVGSNVNCRTMEFTIDVFLEGPFETSNMLMHNKLRTQCNTVPLFQPYNSPTMGYNGTESVGSLSNDVVDWVLVSFRTNTDRTSEIHKVAALLGRDGKVRTITGDTIFQLNSSASDSLYVVVEHRNHMGVMTATKMCADHADNNGVICVDFTHMQSYVTGSPATAGQKVLGTDNQGTVYGMHSGDGDCNFDINSSDFVPFGTDFNKFDMYSPGDFNMDCDCNSNDLPKWLGNFNQFSGVR